MDDASPGTTVPVIMAGGAGTRFWPLSTPERPKQFLHLFGDRSLLRLSFERARALAPVERILVLTNARFTDLVRSELPELPRDNVVGEPARRDTAAAAALAALLCRRRFDDAVMAVLTADHLIEPLETFVEAVRSAARVAAGSAALYTFGVEPTCPATAYGYLETGEVLDADPPGEHFRLRRFVEKPDADRARAYLASGGFLWNSGMFVWTPEAILEAFRRHLPGHLEALEPVVRSWGGGDPPAALAAAFESLPSVSVDFGVMEKADDVRMVKALFSWKDVGGWVALEEFLESDADGNARRGRLETLKASSNLVFCEDESETVALVGVEDLVVVRAGTVTLVVRRADAENVRDLVTRLGGA